MATDQTGIRSEFHQRELNELGVQRSNEVCAGFSRLLDLVEARLPVGRDRSLGITGLQETLGHVLRGIASQPDNQA